MSQTKIVLHHLRTEGSITALEAMRRYRIFRLSARILDIRDAGHRIKTIMHESDSPGRAGDFAEYRLISDE